MIKDSKTDAEALSDMIAEHMDKNAGWDTLSVAQLVLRGAPARCDAVTMNEADPHFCAMVNAARDEHIRLKGFAPYTAEIIAMLKAALSLPAAQSSDAVTDQPFVEMLWKWFEDRGVDLRPERSTGLTADDFRIMLDEHEAAVHKKIPGSLSRVSLGG